MKFRYFLLSIVLALLLHGIESAKPKTTKKPTVTKLQTTTTTTTRTTKTTASPRKAVSGGDKIFSSALIYYRYQFFDIIKFYNHWYKSLLRRCRRRFSYFAPVPFCKIPPLFNHLPESFDLRNYDLVTSIGNETIEHCDASWAYALATSMESAWLDRQTTLRADTFRLSRQQLIDCVGRSGCKGSYDVTRPYKYLLRHGLERSNEYPYRGKKRRCRAKYRVDHFKIKRLCAICPTSVEIIQRFLYRYKVALTTILQIRNWKAFLKIGDEVVTEDKGKRVRKILVGNIIGWRKDPKTKKMVWVVRANIKNTWGMGGDIYVDASSNLFNILNYNFLVTVQDHKFPPEEFFDYLLDAF